MRILLLGATGKTGQQLVKQALDQLHELTVIARNPGKLSISHPNLIILKGDVLDKEMVSSAVEGKDAVISALGAGLSLRSRDIIYQSLSVLIPAMTAKNVNRLIFLSAFGVGSTFRQANLIQRIIFRLPLKNIYTDKEKGEELLEASQLDWTLIKPVVLTDKPYTGKYKVGEKFVMKGTPKITRADVAEFMLKQLTDRSFLRKSPILTT